MKYKGQIYIYKFQNIPQLINNNVSSVFAEAILAAFQTRP